MKCVYRKLKESVTDSSFPILPVIVEKSYITDTDVSQTVDISDIISGLNYNQIKIEAVVKFPSLDYDAVEAYAVETRGGYQKLGSARLNGIGRIGSQNELRKSITANTDIVIVLDSANNKVTVDGTEQTGSGTVSSSAITTAKIFGSRPTASAGYIYIKNVKITNQSTNTLIADIVPATVAGVACLWNKVTDDFYYPDTGVLLAID